MDLERVGRNCPSSLPFDAARRSLGGGGWLSRALQATVTVRAARRGRHALPLMCAGSWVGKSAPVESARQRASGWSKVAGTLGILAQGDRHGNLALGRIAFDRPTQQSFTQGQPIREP